MRASAGRAPDAYVTRGRYVSELRSLSAVRGRRRERSRTQEYPAIAEPSESAGSQAKLGLSFEYHVVSLGCVEEVMPVTVPGTANATLANVASRKEHGERDGRDRLHPWSCDALIWTSLPPLLHGAP